MYPVQLEFNWLELYSLLEDRISEADMAFSKSERFPSAWGAWTGNLSPFTKDQVTLRMYFPQINYTTNQLYWSYTLVIIASLNRYVYWLF